MCGWVSTLASSSSGLRVVVEMPTRMAPRSRMWRVSALVSMSLMPTTPWASSSASRLRRDRQLEGRGAGSRTM